MNDIRHTLVKPDDNESIELIAGWYLTEWNIPKQTTIEKLKGFSADGLQFQLLIMLDGLPIATGGLYHHVGLLDKEPKFKVYKHWLALVYTAPEHRSKGYGALLCNAILARSKELGLKDIYLFTYTAERLYKRLDWQPLERFTVDGKDIVVMKKEL